MADRDRTVQQVIANGTAAPELQDIAKQLNGIFPTLFRGKEDAARQLAGLKDAAEVTGFKNGNAALTSLIAVLVAKGIITDSTT